MAAPKKDESKAPEGVTTLEKLGESKVEADTAEVKYVRLINPVNAGVTEVPESIADALLDSGFERA